MARLVVVSAGMFARGAVAAPNVTAGETHAQMHGAGALGKARTAGHTVWRGARDRVEMHAVAAPEGALEEDASEIVRESNHSLAPLVRSSSVMRPHASLGFDFGIVWVLASQGEVAEHSFLESAEPTVSGELKQLSGRHCLTALERECRG